jgi:hypothetical protein
MGGVVRPAWWWFALLDGGIAVLALLAGNDSIARRSPVPLPGPSLARRMLVATAAIHLVEAVGAARVAHRRGLSTRRWAGQTFVVGFPSLVALRRGAAGTAYAEGFPKAIPCRHPATGP